jgi:hypothetical protein
MNADWHATHPMPRNPTLEQRLAWHLGHRRRCNCRPMPPRLAALAASKERQGLVAKPAKKARAAKRVLESLFAGPQRLSLRDPRQSGVTVLAGCRRRIV